MSRIPELIAPESYRRATEQERRRICNGCGTKGLGGWLVPDTLYGLSIEEACDIHDWMYHEGRTEVDKRRADQIFLENMLRIVEAQDYPWWLVWLRWLRRYRAMSYYQAVRDFGDTAFWKGKERPEKKGGCNG